MNVLRVKLTDLSYFIWQIIISLFLFLSMYECVCVWQAMMILASIYTADICISNFKLLLHKFWNYICVVLCLYVLVCSRYESMMFNRNKIVLSFNVCLTVCFQSLFSHTLNHTDGIYQLAKKKFFIWMNLTRDFVCHHVFSSTLE